MGIFVGRAAELKSLQAALRGAGRGGGGGVLVSGEPGIGKTRLLGQLAEHARSEGWTVLAGRADELAGALPYGLFVDALDDRLAELGPARLGLDVDALAELAAIFPGLAARPARLTGLGEERVRAHAAAARALERLTGTAPALLVLDDVHWADPASLELLSFLLRRPPRRVLLALASRSGRGEPADLRAQRLELGPLSAEEAALLAPGRSARELARVYEESGGNPFLLEQLVRGGRSSGASVPERVTVALARELRELSPAARLLAQGAALMPEPVDPQLAARVGELEHDALAAALAELREADLLRGDRFRHPLVRRAVQAAAGPGWVLLAHRRAADALIERGAPAGRIAPHLEACAPPGDLRAAELLADAAHGVAPRAPASAARWLAAALRLIPDTAELRERRLGLRTAMASALATAGQARQSRDELRAALAELPADAPARTRAQLAAQCAAMELALREVAAARDLLLAEWRRAASADAAVRSTLALALATVELWVADPEPARRWAQRAIDLVPAGDRPSLAAATALLAIGEWRAGERAMFEHGDAAAALVDSFDDEQAVARIDALMWTSWLEVHLERLPAAQRHAERGLALARASGQGHVVMPLLVAVGYAHYWNGRLEQSIASFDELVESARLGGAVQFECWGLAQGAWPMMASGDAVRAVEMCRRARDLAAEHDDTQLFVASGSLAMALTAAGDSPAEAIELLVGSGGGADLPRNEPTWRPWWYEVLTNAELARGQVDAAAEWAARAQRAAERYELPGRHGFAARAQAAVALAGGDPQAAMTFARTALEAFARAQAPLDLALARLLLGRALAAAGEDAAARTELERAHGELGGFGAERYGDEAARALRAVGVRVGRAGRRGSGEHGAAALSGREREIAGLVSQGMTNREIAAALFISERTVETHLSKVFGKLGVRSRAAVAAALHERQR